ncbi:hypothetical protein TNCV_1960621 [Trichonephila clavipes]|nr:hypothetical protein TNCV_1960621 [Trichonephila clavipes]
MLTGSSSSGFHNGLVQIHFLQEKSENNNKGYQDIFLEPIGTPPNVRLYRNHCTFQQGSAPAHETNTIQQWLKENVLDFIEHKEGSFSSQDLSLLNDKLGSVLEEKVCQK